MRNVVVVSRVEDWPLAFPGAEVVTDRDYLVSGRYDGSRRLRVFNLARSYRYQRSGYYVSLLAEARGHRPIPSVETIQELKSASLLRQAGSELDDAIQKSLAPIAAEDFTLSVYFGRNMAARHDRLARALFHVFPAPLLRAKFIRHEASQQWTLRSVEPIAAEDIPPQHGDFVVEMMKAYFDRRGPRARKRSTARYDLAILVNPEEAEPPSDRGAIRKFIRAAATLDIRVDLIGKDDAGRLAEYDALFIRETTAVNHRTFRFAQRAAAAGLVVIDDPQSILRCTNKVLLAEILERHEIPAPRTVVLHRDNQIDALETLKLPCVLKQPDSSYSQGVVKVDTFEEFETQAERLLEKSSLIVAQEFLPTDFDWRIGVLANRPLYACRYGMAPEHWQIINRGRAGRAHSYGRVTAVPLGEVPSAIVDAALAAASHMGDGLYGADVKEVGGRPYVIEVNDNPTIESGLEDELLGDELYRRIMEVFLERIEARHRATRT